MNETFCRVLRRTTCLLTAALLLLPAGARAAPRGVDAVSVAAVNYTGNELNGVLFINPEDKDKVAGGPPVQPYSGNGGMCCYALPHKWKPGIKVKVRYDWWGGDSTRNFQFLNVELTPYPTGEPGTLWAVFYENGTTEVFASAVDPGHPKWPGKINHWPIPSQEYKLKLWQIEYDQFASSIPYAKRMRDGLSESELKSAWDTRSKYSPKTMTGFAGPDDPKFIEYIKTEGQSYLSQILGRLKQLEEVKP